MGTENNNPKHKAAYLFLDEGGDFNFSKTGTRCYTITSVLKYRPFKTSSMLASLRYDLIENGTNLEYFHASEDRQFVRDRVFEVICSRLKKFEVDSIIIEKPKTHPSLHDPLRFYLKMLGYLLSYVLNRMALRNITEVIVITDQLPLQKKKKAFEKAIKHTLKEMLPSKVTYQLLHHSSKSASGLQIADYFNWAIFRAWERGDRRSIKLVEEAINSQFDIFESGDNYYYGYGDKK